MSDTFSIKVYIKKDSRYKINEAHWQRKIWVYLFPFYDGWLECGLHTSDSSIYSYYFDEYEYYGYTALLWTNDNYFKIVLNYETADSSVDKTKDFYLGFPLASTPASSEWEMDINTGTIIQIK